MDKLKAFRAIAELLLVFGILVITIFTGLIFYIEFPEIFKKERINPEAWKPNNPVEDLAYGVLSEDVKYGYYLIAESPKYMGPAAENKHMRYAGNNLACKNCHLQNGTQAGSGSWVGILERFPQFSARGNKNSTIEDRINGCMERSMDGKKLPEDSEEMKAIIAYMAWVSEGLPEERKKEFEGYPKIKIPDFAADPEIGKLLYAKQCALCHGEDGQGVAMANAEDGYQYPPLWGKDSYNNGAGMHRVLTAAEFIKANMPFELATWDNPKLTDEEAYHLAAYINSFERPLKANTENDFPDRKLKPVSTPYGPWADSFSAKQHKYGPFPPIIEYYQKKYKLTKNK